MKRQEQLEEQAADALRKQRADVERKAAEHEQRMQNEIDAERIKLQSLEHELRREHEKVVKA